ncbi:MAG: DnaJ domain-containing protein [Oscillospiraceae bacterium]|nr:DnaJ domain-containing protein [Oscillospiraceae bacterium]
MSDPYIVLGVNANASDEEIKRAYRDLARKYHPDNYQNNPLSDLAEEKMKEINEAYETITRMRSGGGASYGGSSGFRGGASSGGGGAYSGGSSAGANMALFAQIRTAINRGALDEAEQLLRQAPQSAEWHFLSGSIAYRRGWMDEAQQQYYRACQMDPNNLEYRRALDFMQRSGMAYRPAGFPNINSNAGLAASQCCAALMCANCLCGHGC